MRYAVISVRTEDEFWDHALGSARRIDAGEGYQGEHFGFTTPEQLFSIYTPGRWTLIQTLQRVGPTSVRGLARELSRDVKRVFEDVKLLMHEHVIERNERKQIFVPFETIRFEAEIKAPTKAA